MTTVERFVEIEKFGRRNLLLEQCEGILIREGLITPEVLAEDAQKWNGYSFGVGLGNNTQLDDLILRKLAYGTMPLKIIGESAESAGVSLKLSAELVKFPPSRELRWTSYGVRLIPKSGRIAQIILDRRSELAINHVEQSADSVAFDFGNGSLHLEVYYNEQDPETLPPLTPPVFS